MSGNFYFFKSCFLTRRGVVYIMTMSLLVLFDTAALTFLAMAHSDSKIVEAQMDSIRAFYNAESAAAKSISEFLNAADSDGNGIGQIAPVDSDGDAKIDYQAFYFSTTGNERIQAIGYSGNVQRMIIVRINPIPFAVISWKGNNSP